MTGTTARLEVATVSESITRVRPIGGENHSAAELYSAMQSTKNSCYAEKNSITGRGERFILKKNKIIA